MDGSSRPRAPQPAPPDRAFSFTDWQTAHPTEPPPGDKLDAELDRTNQAVEDVIDWVSTSLNSDGSLVEPPVTDPPPETGAVALAQDWADVSVAWAEHMPDTIPPNILATMAITGDHWSSRWWANRAAQIVSRGTPPLLPPGQPDGVTDNSAALQAAIDAAAGVVDGDRAAAPGFSQLVIPAAPFPYIIGKGLFVPSNSHIIIEQGATLMLPPNAPQMNLLSVGGSSNVILEHYGTLDGNRLNQPGFLGTGDGNGVNCGIGGGPCHNVFITGNKQGVIKNFKNWPVNLGAGNIKGQTSSNIEVRGISMTDSGNSCEIAGINPRVNVVAGSSYDAGTGAIIFVADAPHRIAVGETFCFSAAVTPSNYLQGEYVATAVPNANEVHAHVTVPTVGTGPILGGHISFCNRCYNVGFVDCYVARIPDLGIVLYSGCTGGYLRGIELTECGSTGPCIFADNGQPASNEDCEISGCYVHDTYGSGIAVTSNTIGIAHKNSRVFNNLVVNCMLGGVQIGASDGVEVFGNTVHNSGAISMAKQTAMLTIATSAIKANVFGNTLREANKSVVGHTGTLGFPFVAGPPLYNSTTGQVVLQTTTGGSGSVGANPPPLNHNINPGDSFFVQMAVGTDDCKLLEGWQIADAGTSGSTLYFTVDPGLTFTLRRINIQQFTYQTITSHVEPGTYTSDVTGFISVQTYQATSGDGLPHGYPVGAWFVIDQVGGSPPGTGGATDYAGSILNGQQLAKAGTSGTTLNFIVTPNSTVVVTNGGRVLPANFGIMISGVDEADASGTSPGTGPDYLRLSGNRMGDYQGASINMVCAIGGVWGLNGASDGNYCGPRRAIDPDVSDYNKSGVNGFNYDLVYNNAPANMLITGPVTFGPGVGAAKYLPPQGLTPSWNYRVGRGEVDFFCGQGGGAPGGFEFFQVQVIHVAGTGSTYDPVTGIVTLVTTTPHTVLPGGTFSLNNPTGTDTTDTGNADVLRIRGSHTANNDTTGTTLTFNSALNMTITSITGGTVVPAHTGGGLVNTSVGVAGSLLANDGLGNTRLGGALVHGAMQMATLTAGGTVTVNPNTSLVLVQNASSIATGSVVLPAPAAGSYQLAGSELEVRFQNPVGTLTMTAATGAAIAGPPTAVLSAGSSFRFVLSEPGNIWLPRLPDVSGTAPVGGPYLPLIGGGVTGPTTFGALTTHAAGLAVSGGTLTAGVSTMSGLATFNAGLNSGGNQTFAQSGTTQINLAFQGNARTTWGLIRDATASGITNEALGFGLGAYLDTGAFSSYLWHGTRASGPTGQGGPWFDQMRPFAITQAKAGIPGDILGNNITLNNADVQPITTLGTNPLATTSGSPIVVITWTGCGSATGVFLPGGGQCFVNLLGVTAVGGITPTGWLQGTRVDNDHFSVTWTSNATSTATGGGSVVTVQPNFAAAINKTAVTLTTGGAGFPVADEQFMVAAPAFYQPVGSPQGPNYHQEWRQVVGPPDPSPIGTNHWGLTATEMDLVHRGPDGGYSPDIINAANPTMGFYCGAIADVPPWVTGGGTISTNFNTVYTVKPNFGRVGNYVGFSTQPTSMVGAANDPTGHGGVGFVSFGSYTYVAAGYFTTAIGTSTITITINALWMQGQTNGNSVYIPKVATLNGVTFGGASYVMSGCTANTFNITGTGTASSSGTGGGAVSQAIYFANLVPYAPMEFQGSFKHGLSTTNFRSEDGSIIRTQPGNGVVWDNGTGGVASITGTSISSSATVLQLGTMPINAVNDAAAATALVPVGGIYRNGSVLMVRVV